MADTMQFDLVSPERKLTSVQAREVRIPSAEGELTAMPGHAALITTLRPGILTVVGPEGTADYAVTGGFAELTPEGVTVLADEVAAPAQPPAVPDEILQKPYLFEIVRHLYRWYLDEADVDHVVHVVQAHFEPPRAGSFGAELTRPTGVTGFFTTGPGGEARRAVRQAVDGAIGTALHLLKC